MSKSGGVASSECTTAAGWCQTGGCGTTEQLTAQLAEGTTSHRPESQHNRRSQKRNPSGGSFRQLYLGDLDSGAFTMRCDLAGW